MSKPRTLYEKLWDSHVVRYLTDETALLYVDRHLLHEVSTPQSFVALDKRGCGVHRPAANLAVPDHAIPTRHRDQPIADPQARAQTARLVENVERYGIPFIPLNDIRQGIVHVMGPEQGFTLPGTTLACGDSHTSTHGAFGTLAFGVGASECGIVMAAQALVQRKARTMAVRIEGTLSPGVSAKDVALAFIAKVGINGAAGYAIEYLGPVVRGFSMEARMTLCNMAIEAGARVALVAPDDITFDWLKGRPMVPKGDLWDQAVSYWRSLPSDEAAVFDREVTLDAGGIAPHVTWGTSPEDTIAIDGMVPDPETIEDEQRRARLSRALDYMGLLPGRPIAGTPVDMVFIGSCTNGRLVDLEAAAEIVKGRKVAPHVQALVVPGSGLVKQAAEEKGLDRIFIDAGFEWREAGCSMCVAMNDDRLKPGQRCASTSNRNFEGRQGRGGRTHLLSPAMAAAAAITGTITDIRKLEVRS
ncbi:3-isopropylmalate/(R)-2-methylmalate dehydratase large subunit [Rhizobium sp. NFR07]|uniref:3-isopropylmalate dehydratase large subunit n=1 Tax=Rhizobium sp. NFR07 TaxID=1566262 RepID=UPI0008F32A1A|nr:3-isopropylmalate dehydratase large subunit [Rhizobium sp. NFR07]SFB28232.1 3-isopropylmalate/(R)-2-methylmalate dehydratase large subunit [Rhizobium sp. NFR07]